MTLNIIYQDDYFLVIDKPPGLVVDKSNTQITGTLEEILQDEYKIKLERGGIVHRLDKDTSGIILVAKTQEALENLQSQFKERVVKKEYTTLVHGFILEGGIIEGAIGRNPDHREKFTVLQYSDTAKEAVTKYEPVKRLQIPEEKLETIFEDFNNIQMRKLNTIHYNQFTLVKCYPQTGRTHQIRVHLKYINHPLVSDAIYSGRKVYRLDHRWCDRQFLHASKVELDHPKSGKKVVFESFLPEDLTKALGFLEYG